MFPLTRMAAVASLLLAAGAHAADKPSSFVLTAYSNDAAGAEVLSGQYKSALELLAHPKSDSQLYYTAARTNECVAYSALRQLDEAQVACDRAISTAKRSKVPVQGLRARRDQNEMIALAYSNRAVLRWMRNDDANAAADMDTAMKLAPRADFVARNMLALSAPGSKLARVEVVAPK